LALPEPLRLILISGFIPVTAGLASSPRDPAAFAFAFAFAVAFAVGVAVALRVMASAMTQKTTSRSDHL
jgi:uncharacterized protein involved in propanediol utilization